MRQIAILLLLFALAGCSRTELLYRNADWLLLYRAQSLLDPTPQQVSVWQDEIEQALQQHRLELLPELVTLLRSAETLATQALKPDDLACWLNTAETSVFAHVAWSLPTVSSMLGDLAPDQVRHLEEALRERNQDYRDDYLEPEPAKQIQGKQERVRKRIEYWIGDLDAKQEHLVDQAVAQMPDIAGPWLVYRQQQQQGLLSLLREQASAQAIRGYLSDWLIEGEGRFEPMKADYEATRVATFELILQIDRSLNERQRTRLIATLEDLRSDLEVFVEPTARVAQLPCLGALSVSAR